MKAITYLADRLCARGARKMVDPQELVDVAVMEVIRAKSRFDPRKSSFKTFAIFRARGAMQDELREMDHVPRLERARAKKDGRVLREMESMDADFTITTRPDRRFPIPLTAAAATDLWLKLPEMVGDQDARVVELYYRRDLTLLEIARELGLSESRICQLHARAIRRLRWKLKENA